MLYPLHKALVLDWIVYVFKWQLTFKT